ncbi:hypothetical protein [Micromonospora echinofusca]|uniref:Uncharacterized protein n=1 Tax=Micromonospora echinofusca TaxID=47858 RepID=A0ABS3VZP3_MICEH|nr:hypothetical protein [Micromonospora echinofusca]MBO4210002.1 hypothetical protein [Micromonospora echinofusca]
MITRLWARFAAVAGLALAAIAASSTPALATDYSFTVSHYHASGALATQVTGNIVWHNRSAQLTNIRIYTLAGECAYGEFFGYHNGTAGYIDHKSTAIRCSNVNMWHDNISDITIEDSSSAQIRIDWIGIIANDDTHIAYSAGSASRY